MVRIHDRPLQATLLRRTQGTVTTIREARGQRRIPYLPREQLLALRDARVRDLAAFAVRTVPWYRDAPPIESAEDLADLPLITRDDVQEQPLAFRPETAGAGLVLQTTGSTAAPIEVVHDRHSVLANIAHGERTRAVEAEFAGSRLRYSALDVRARAGTSARVQEYYASELFRPLRPTRHSLTVESSPLEVVTALETIRPAIFRSYGTFAELVFRAAAARGGLRHRPRAVVYAGDTMSSAGHALIEEEFGVPVLSRYNAVECFHIAFTCEVRDGFHIHEDLCHVRIVDAAGNPVPAGERGEVVLSNLVNRGTVLLNYRLGDVARYDETPCACGRTSARLVDLEGRVDDVIELDGGLFVYPTEVWRAFRGRSDVLRYQLVQHERARFELRAVVRGADGERAAEAAAADLAATLGGAPVAVTFTADLSAGPGGKFRHIVPLRPKR